MSTTTTSKIRTITLTDRAPVRIREDAWPVIARGWDGDNRAIPHQSNRQWTIRVRQHADGRSIVYGVYSSDWQGETGCKAGVLLAAGAALVPAIHRVGEDIGAPDAVVRGCIADLPAEDL